MNIDAPGAVRAGAVRRTRSAPAAKSGAFSQEIADVSTPAAATVNNAPQIDAVDALLTVQEIQSDQSGDNRRAVDYAEDLLRRMDAIRMGLLNGAMSRTDLEGIVRRLAERGTNTIDPRLALVLDDIELRARVELAKLSVL